MSSTVPRGLYGPSFGLRTPESDRSAVPQESKGVGAGGRPRERAKVERAAESAIWRRVK